MPVNNVVRMLQARKVPFTVYELPQVKLSAEETAEYLNVPLSQVFKTIVVTRQGSGKPILALVSAEGEVDLKKLAKAIGDKKVTLPTQKEAEKITGLKAGGISPLALLNKGFEVIIDERAMEYEEIHISGGQLGCNIRLPLHSLIDLTQARVLPIGDYSRKENNES